MEPRNTIRLIVGLGNPGPKYSDTRHNAGASLIEKFCKHYRILLRSEPKFNARLASWSSHGTDCTFLIPNSYMNHSGQSVGAFVKYYHLSPDSILIAHDELDLAPGEIRLKIGGGHAGHNGLRDIIHHLDSRDFLRLRMGIGHPGNKEEVSDYVLSPPSKMEAQKIQKALDESIQTLPDIITGNVQHAIQYLHNLKIG